MNADVVYKTVTPDFRLPFISLTIKIFSRMLFLT